MSAAAMPAPAVAVKPTVDAVYATHGDFVWRTLQRLGVREADVEDQFQEVFLVVHRRLHTYDGSARMTTWLYGVCLRVAAAYRRRAWFRRVLTGSAGDALDLVHDVADDPEQGASNRESQARLRRALDALAPEARGLIVMFELEGVACEQLAEMLGVPLGTVYSRLHTARRAFREKWDKLAKEDAQRAGGAR